LTDKSRTREAPTPTNISTKSEPDMLKTGHLLHRQPLLPVRFFQYPEGLQVAHPLDFTA
jgi:hypothetical protein